MPMGLCSSTPSRHQPSIALSTTTTTSAPRRTRLAKSGARISVLKQVGALCGRWGLDEVLAFSVGDRAGVAAGRGHAAWGSAAGAWRPRCGCRLAARGRLPWSWCYRTQLCTGAFCGCGRSRSTSVCSGETPQRSSDPSVPAGASSSNMLRLIKQKRKKKGGVWQRVDPKSHYSKLLTRLRRANSPGMASLCNLLKVGLAEGT